MSSRGRDAVRMTETEIRDFVDYCELSGLS